MEMRDVHLQGAKYLALAGWASRTLSVSCEPLSRARASIADTFERSENATIALACWAIKPLAK